MRTETLRGIAFGLWILTGLAFLVGALLPGSTGGLVLGPALLALSCLTTALAVPGSAGNERATRYPRPSGVVRITLAAIVVALVFAIALTIIREGDQRSWIFVLFTAITALVLGSYRGAGESTR